MVVTHDHRSWRSQFDGFSVSFLTNSYEWAGVDDDKFHHPPWMEGVEAPAVVPMLSHSSHYLGVSTVNRAKRRLIDTGLPVEPGDGGPFHGRQVKDIENYGWRVECHVQRSQR